MKRKVFLTLIIVFLFKFVLMAQDDTSYKGIIAKLVPIRTEIVNKKYNNGNQKETGTYNIYNSSKFEHEIAVGKHILYYPEGQIMEETLYDSFGTPLEWKLYDGNGNLLQEFKTIKIDTNKETVEEILSDEKSVNITTQEKKYKFSDKICGWYLFKEGKRLNDKKIGSWKKYYPSGEIHKINEY